MPIEIRYEPSAALTGQAAFQTGVGLRGMEEAQRQEQIRQFQQSQAQSLYQQQVGIQGQQWSQIAAGNIQQQQMARAQQYAQQNAATAQQYGLENQAFGTLMGMQGAGYESALTEGRMGYGAELGMEGANYQAALNETAAQAEQGRSIQRMEKGAELQQGAWIEQWKMQNPLQGEDGWARLLSLPQALRDQVNDSELSLLSRAQRQVLDEIAASDWLTPKQKAAAVAGKMGVPEAYNAPKRGTFGYESLGANGGVVYQTVDDERVPIDYVRPQDVVVRGNVAFIPDGKGGVAMQTIGPAPEEVAMNRGKARGEIFGAIIKALGPEQVAQPGVLEDAYKTAVKIESADYTSMMPAQQGSPVGAPSAGVTGPQAGPAGSLAGTAAAAPAGYIKVQRKSDGQTGMIVSSEFNPALHIRLD